MLKEELKQKGHQIISELELAQGNSTQKWMAHYIAELMHQAEHGDSENKRSEAAFQCAEVISRLWDSRLHRARYNAISIFNNLGYRGSYEKWEGADPVRSLLAASDKQYIPTETWEKSLVLSLLSVPERLLIWLVVSAKSHNAKSDVIQEESDDEGWDEEQVTIVRRHLQDIFPEVENLDLENQEDVEQFVEAALNAIHNIRKYLFE